MKIINFQILIQYANHLFLVYSTQVAFVALSKSLGLFFALSTQVAFVAPLKSPTHVMTSELKISCKCLD